MNTLRTLSLATVLAVFAGGAAVAQTTDTPRNVGTNVVGHWLHDENGTTIGSVRSLSSDGRTANLMIGAYFEPGSHAAQVPLSTLSMIHGNVTLQRTTEQALNVPSR